MNDLLLPLALGFSDPTTPLATARDLTFQGIEQLRAAREVEWAAPAALLYQAHAEDAVLAAAHDLSLVEEAMRRAVIYLAAGRPG